MMRHATLSFAIGVLWLSNACDDTPTPTQVVVELHSDLESELAAIDVEVRDAQDKKSGSTHHFAIDKQLALPFSFAVAPNPAADPSFVLVATGRDAHGDFLSQIKTRVSFAAGKSLLMVVWVPAACRGVECDSGESCDAFASGAARCAAIHGPTAKQPQRPASLAGASGSVAAGTVGYAGAGGEGGTPEQAAGAGAGGTAGGGAGAGAGGTAGGAAGAGSGGMPAIDLDSDECATQPGVCGEFSCRDTTPDYECQSWTVFDDLQDASVDTQRGVVIDSNTMLIWQRELQNCDKDATSPTCTWSEAKSYCDKLVLAGADDWRLPTPVELLSIVDMTMFGPAIDQTLFPDTPGQGFWTASLYEPLAPMYAWYVNAYHGSVDNTPVGKPNNVRCVRSR
jgi:hypothetical protein